MADLTEQQLIGALRKADAAGDVAAAKAIAKRIQSVRQGAKADFSDVSSTLEQTPAKMRGASYNPFGGPRGVGTQLGGALDAFQHHVGNIGQGISQGVSNLANAGVQAVAGGTELGRAAQMVNDKNNIVARARERQYQQRTDGNALSYAGAAAGEILPWMAGIGALRTAGALPKATSTAQKVALLAAEGGTMGTVQPVVGDGSYAGQKAAQVGVGAATGPVLMGAAKAAGGVRNVADHVFRPQVIADANVARLFGANQQTADALRNAPRFVPGETPTAAQVLATPEAVQAERALRTNPASSPAFVRGQNANEAARMGVVRNLAGDDAQLQAAVQARRDGPGMFYKENLARGAENGRYGRAAVHLKEYSNSKNMPMAEFKVLDEARRIAGQIERGSISQAEGDAALRALAPTSRGGQKALDQALGLIDGGMVNPNRVISTLEELAKDTNPTISKAAASALESIGKNQDGQGWVHARVLNGLRENIGNMLADHAPNGAVGSREAAAYGPVKAKITNTIDRAVPGYRDNLAAYARASEPINTMESVQRLLDPNSPGSLNASGDPFLSAARLKNVLRGDDKARYPMSDDARSQLEQVRESLSRQSISDNKIGPAGSNTAADLQAHGALASAMFGSNLSRQGGWLGRSLGTAAGGVGGSFLGGPAGAVVGAGVGAGLSDGIGAVNSNIARRVGETAASSDLSAEAIERYLQQQSPGQLRLFLERYALPYQP